MNKQRRDQIESRAEQILRNGSAYRAPVPLDLVLQSLQLMTQPTGLDDDISGVLVVENKRAGIGYNSNHAPVRQRFTIAHEIGHYVLHVSKPLQPRLFIDRYVVFRRDGASAVANDQEEVEANAFAAALLMPAEFLREEIRKSDFDLDDDDDVIRLAKKFNVSTSAMSNRLAYLGLLR